MQAVGQTTSGCPKTLENHSVAETRTEAKLLALGFNFAEMLLKLKMVLSVKIHMYLKTNIS